MRPVGGVAVVDVDEALLGAVVAVAADQVPRRGAQRDDAELDRVVVRGEPAEEMALVQQPECPHVARRHHVVELTGALLRRPARPVDVGARPQRPPDEGGRVPVEVAQDGVVEVVCLAAVHDPVHHVRYVVATAGQPVHGVEDGVAELHAERGTGAGEGGRQEPELVGGVLGDHRQVDPVAVRVGLHEVDVPEVRAGPCPEVPDVVVDAHSVDGTRVLIREHSSRVERWQRSRLLQRDHVMVEQAGDDR